MLTKTVKVEGADTKPKADSESVSDSPQKFSEEDFYKRLDYSDVTGENLDISDNGKKYARALAKGANEHGIDEINKVVDELRSRFDALMGQLDKSPSEYGRSESWIIWDIGKQLHMLEAPYDSSDKYRLANPLVDQQIQDEIVYRMIGWEVTDGGDYPSHELLEIGRNALSVNKPDTSNSYNIDNINISLSKGSLVDRKCDAHVIPQFETIAASGGVSGSFKESEAACAINDYHSYASSMMVPLGEVYLTDPKWDRSKKLINVAMVHRDLTLEQKLAVVHFGLLKALKAASSKENGFTKISIPLLGTGAVMQLEPSQSALAMFSAFKRFSEESGKNLDLEFVIFDKGIDPDNDLYKVEKILRDNSYETFTQEKQYDNYQSFAEWEQSRS